MQHSCNYTDYFDVDWDAIDHLLFQPTPVYGDTRSSMSHALANWLADVNEPTADEDEFNTEMRESDMLCGVDEVHAMLARRGDGMILTPGSPIDRHSKREGQILHNYIQVTSAWTWHNSTAPVIGRIWRQPRRFERVNQKL